MLKIYFRAAVRNLWKNKTFSFLNIFGLAIGICCAGLIFLWVEDELTYDHFHAKKDRLYRVNVNASFDGTVFTMGSTPRPMGEAMTREIPGVVNAARMSDERQTVLFRVDDKSIYVTGRYADGSLFSMFSFDFIQGNAQSAFTQLNSVVITRRTAEKLFGDKNNAVGKTIVFNNEKNLTISGVIEELPDNSTLQFEWLAPYALTLRDDDATDWGSFGPFTYVELDKAASPATVNARLKNYIEEKKPGKKREAFLQAMTDWRMYNEFKNGKPTGSGRIREVQLLSVIAWIILIIACINFMNLATANSQKRAKEVGIHKTLGAGRKGLVAQFMGEALMMSFLAAMLAVLLIQLSLPMFNLFMQKQLAADIFNPLHLMVLLAIALISGLIAGSYPSMYLSSFKPVLVLKGLKVKTGGAVFVRKGLVVLQFTVSIIFICGAIIVYGQIQHVKNRQLGLNKDNLLEIDMQHGFAAVFPAMKQELLNTGLVDNVAIADHSTLQGGNTDDRFRWQGKSPSSQVSIAFRNVSPEFMGTAGMKIVEGRNFTSDLAAEKNNVIITQSFAKLLGGESAIGKIIQSPRGNKEGVFTNVTVVGVVNDYVYGDMFGYAGPVVFFCNQSERANLLYVRARMNTNASTLLMKLDELMKKYNPGYPLTYKFVDDQFNELFLNEVLVGKMSGVFAVLAIIISCLGLFGLSAYTAEQRTKEIGIRKVLGASVVGMVRLLSKDFLMLVILSCGVAFPLAWWLGYDWLQQYEYRIGISAWIFVAAGLAAVVIALLTVSWQAVKAALVSPVKSLKAE